MTPRRVRRWLLLALPAGALVAALALASRPGLVLRHALQLRLVRLATVATVDVARVGPVRMFLNPDDAVVTPRIMAEGVWEPNETHWFTRFVGVGDTVLDVGANVGYYTLLASRLVGETGRVYAFEPEPTAFALLERNVRVNGARNVVLEQKAVSDAPGTLQLFLAERNKGDHRIYQTDEGRVAIDVEAVRLDDYLADVAGTVDFVKIDTQGAEALIIAGMAQTIAATPGIVLAVEFWPFGLAGLGSDAAALLRELRGHDFRLFNLGPGFGDIRKLQEVHLEGLLRAHTVQNERFTNLLAVKGFAELRRLTWDAEAKRRALARKRARARPNDERLRQARAAVALAEAALDEYQRAVVPP